MEQNREDRGISPKEQKDEVTSSAQKLLAAYKENVASILAEQSQQHGVSDPKGHIHYAQQLIRILKTAADPRVDPYHWPKEFKVNEVRHIPVVFINEIGDPMVRDLEPNDFNNPKKLVEAVETILTVGQIKGL